MGTITCWFGKAGMPFEWTEAKLIFLSLKGLLNFGQAKRTADRTNILAENTEKAESFGILSSEGAHKDLGLESVPGTS